MERTSHRRNRGLTAIELLIVIAIGALLIVFGVPLMGSAAWKCEVEPAVELTEKSVAQARTLARLYKTDVVVKLETDAGHAPQITVSIPRSRLQADVGEIREQVELPGGVRILSGDMAVLFDANGDVDFPATVTLAANDDRHEAHKLVID
jgi:prepilin-type N-terminal cleavage/methylation domain-containing protein